MIDNSELNHAKISDCLKIPTIVQLLPNFYVAAFSVLKILPAAYIIDRGREERTITSKTLIVESTSGTFGLALAIVCAEYNQPLTVVGDSNIDTGLARRLRSLGANLRIVERAAAVGGMQQARLDAVDEIRAQNPDSFWPAQYDNPDNRHAYHSLARMLRKRIGRIDCLVGTVGTGGSMCGTGAALRDISKNLHVVGIDTHGSVLFGQKDRPGRLLRGLGNSIMPKNVDHMVFDEVHWVSEAVAFKGTQELHQRHALFMGPTSGAAWMVGNWWACKHPDAVVVAILPDEGHRYQETVYNDNWLSAHNICDVNQNTEPTKITNIYDPLDPLWAYVDWNRRTYNEVVEDGRNAVQI